MYSKNLIWDRDGSEYLQIEPPFPISSKWSALDVFLVSWKSLLSNILSWGRDQVLEIAEYAGGGSPGEFSAYSGSMDVEPNNEEWLVPSVKEWSAAPSPGVLRCSPPPSNTGDAPGFVGSPVGTLNLRCIRNPRHRQTTHIPSTTIMAITTETETPTTAPVLCKNLAIGRLQ